VGTVIFQYGQIDFFGLVAKEFDNSVFVGDFAFGQDYFSFLPDGRLGRQDGREN